MRAIVLTGASRGLGSALFDLLYARGDRLLAIARRFTERQEKLAADEPERVILHPCDLAVTDRLPGVRVLTGFLGSTPEVALVHNAATIEPIGAVGHFTPASLTAAVALNLTAPMVLTNAFLAAVSPTARATILFVSSGSAHRAKPGTATYCATKAGGEMFFDSLAIELVDNQRFTVANVDPGGMDTDMQAVIRGTSSYFPDRQRLAERAASGGLASPHEVARRIVAEHFPPG
jgi:NAD(P)-dependent dehydrogenase (short-subunit alcohol dehydrogenase family)